MIGIVDYGMGNLGSIANMIRNVGGESMIVRDAKALQQADKLILPGIGAFDEAVHQLHRTDLWAPLEHYALELKKPLLGICLGMQLLCSNSEEGTRPGLNFIEGSVREFDRALMLRENLTVPHMGWNTVDVVDEQFPLFEDREAGMRFYFVHKYAVHCTNAEDVKGTTTYGEVFHSVIARNNIMGFQCHPEKSHRFGKQVYRNFLAL